LNRRMSETLEAMARALFKSWFVDFLPVHANMEARNRKARTQTGDPVRTKAEGRAPGLPKPLADLFPNSFEDSELGEIPKGWLAAPFREAASLQRDTVNPLDTPDAEFFHFSIPAFDEGGTPKRELGASIKSLKFLVPDDGILFSKLNPSIERVWFVDYSTKATAVCSTEFLVFRARPPFTRSFVYSLARSTNFRRAIQSSVTGTSNSHQRTQPDSVLSILSPLPSRHIIDAFEKIVAPLLRDIQIKNRESRTLAALRDTLLPKLITGELRVRTAAHIVGDFAKSLR
jgi:type I restriction enzyme, S subunit